MTTAPPVQRIPNRQPSQRMGAGSSNKLPAVSIDPFRVLRKHLTVILAACVLGILVGVAFWLVASRMFPQYTGSVKFEIVAALDESDQATTGDLERDEVVIRLARTEMNFLLSRQVLRYALSDPDIRQTEWAKKFITSDGTFDSPEAVDELEEDLGVRYIPDTNLFELLWSSSVPRDVPIVLNRIQRAYLQKRDEIADAQFEGDLRVFSQEESAINTELKNLDEEIGRFVEDSSILTLDAIRDHPLAKEMTEISEAMTKAESDLSLMLSNRDMIAAKMEGELEPTFEDRARAEEDYSIQRTIALITDLSTRLRTLQKSFGPTHNDVKAIQIQLEAAEAERDERMDEVMARNLNAELKSLNNTIESYASMISEQRADIEDRRKQLGEVAKNITNYQSLEERREFLQQERQRTRDLVADLRRIRQRAAADRVRLLTPAETPREKSFPKPEMIIPLAFLLIVGSTIGIIFLRELTDKRVKSASDLAVVPGARVLGVIPDIQDDPTRINKVELAVRDEPRSVIAESYRQSCTPIMKGLERSNHQTLLVLGGLPGSGTTTFITNLAAFIAAGGKRVVAIDANFRRPGLAKALGQTEENLVGLGDMLVDKVGLSDTIKSCGDSIDLIPAGTAANRVFERLNNGKFETIISELRSRYDYILLDAPPAVVAGDALVLANKTDASVIVVRANQEQRGLVSRLISQFSAAQSELIGLVLNRPRFTAGGYFKKNFATMAEYAGKGSS